MTGCIGRSVWLCSSNTRCFFFGIMSYFFFFCTLPFVVVTSFQLQPTIVLSKSSLLRSKFAVSKQQSFILDGGELQSFLLHTNNNNGSTSSSSMTRNEVGSLSLATGTTSNDERVIGVVVDQQEEQYDTISLGNIDIYKHTMARIPKSISDNDALSTAAYSLVGIHCALPKVTSVGGGGNDEVFYSGKAVVMGGNEYASFIADGLSTLGIDVSLVSTGGAKTKNSAVKIMQPSVAVDSGSSNDDNENEVGFATAIGEFDSLVDTLANERKGMIITEDNPYGGSSLLQLLQSRHGCGTYISTLTQSQQIIKNDGVLFGPGKANSHVKSMESISSKQCTSIIPPVGFGPSTLQVLLENNIIFSSKNTKPTAVRGWELKDFWEETSWPRDSSGTGVRYGLPVVEEEDLDEVFRIQQLELQRRKRTRVGTEGGMDEKEVQKQTKVDERNPYVAQIVGVEGLAETIISKQQTGVVFVAMKSCRTCKGINPIFTKLARDRQKKSDDLIFAKADASGAAGKALGRQLGVVAVPAFVLFRNGIRYGAVSASKLPSDRLDQAIMDLEAGKDFDESLTEDEDD